MSKMQISQEGIDFIQQWEALRLKAYEDPGGIVTIGYGHTGDDVSMGDVWTKEEADQAFDTDLEVFEKWVNRFVKVKITQNQYDALVSFTYNAGPGNLQHSKLLRYINNNDFESASKQFLRWNKQNGEVLEGLTRRRSAEKDLFTKV